MPSVGLDTAKLDGITKNLGRPRAPVAFFSDLRSTASAGRRLTAAFSWPSSFGVDLARRAKLDGVVERRGLVSSGPLEDDAEQDVGDATLHGLVAEARFEDGDVLDLTLGVDEEAKQDARARPRRHPPAHVVAIANLGDVRLERALDVRLVQRALLTLHGHLRRLIVRVGGLLDVRVPLLPGLAERVLVPGRLARGAPRAQCGRQRERGEQDGAEH